MFNKNINNNQKNSCLQKLCVLLFLFLATSCNNYGCIDSDDFGEYEIHTFKVESSRLGEYCTYLDGVEDVDQPSGIKDCIRTLCNGRDSENKVIDKKKCSLECQEKCKGDSTATLNTILQSNTPKTAEPLWTSVGGGRDISIEHNSKILITAQGKVDLGSEVQKAVASIDLNHTGKEDWENLRISGNPPIDSSNLVKFSGKENITISIDGQFTDSNNLYFPDKDFSSDREVAKLDFNKINYSEAAIANGARRLFAYFIPFPNAGEFYNDKFPLAPDPSSWQCSMESENGSAYLNCSRNSSCERDGAGTSCDLYSSKFSPSLTPSAKVSKYDFHFSNIFNVDNLSKENSRYNNGTGFIRYRGDNLIATNVEGLGLPLSVSNLAKKFPNFPNNQKDWAVKFKNIPGSTNCSNFKYRIANGFTYNDYSVDLTSLPLKNYTINKKDLENVYYQADGNCSVQVFFYPFHEIEFSESGYIEFGIPDQVFPTSALDLASANNCNLKFKIFNKGAGKDEFANFLYPKHQVLLASVPYHEAVEDQSIPLVTPPAIQTYPHPILKEVLNALGVGTGTFINNNKKYFIRKGQILSFHPDSWNGTWTPRVTSASAQQCGVGFYVKLTPRPAVFCSNRKDNEFININQDLDPANNCNNLYYDNIENKYTGCLEDRSQCQGGMFCPSECIDRDFKACRASNTMTTSNNPYTSAAASCTTSNPENICYDNSDPLTHPCMATNIPAICKQYNSFLTKLPYSELSPSPSNIKASCARCLTALKTTATTPFFLKTVIDLQQCYDLESYTGTMDELRSQLNASDPSDDVNTKNAYLILENPIANGLKAKGLKKLETFDGNYGNIYPLDYTSKVNNNGLPIYKLQKMASIGRAGYLKFIILDDIPTSTTNPDYFEISPNPRSAITMNNNQLRINIKSSNELSNGEGLTIALCKENQSNSDNCSTQNSLSQQKNTFGMQDAALPITEYSTSGPAAESNYAFNDFGQLNRTREIGSLQPINILFRRECNSEENIPYIGANFLCFRDYANLSSSDPSSSNRYRLSFKIFDNESSGCRGAVGSYQDCASTDADCDKYKIINPNWNGEPANSGYCGSEAECIEKYKCNQDKYANNEGYYDVAVKIRRDSKVQVSNFIDSIISPILGQVDGFLKTDKVVYNKASAFLSYINPQLDASATVLSGTALSQDTRIIGMVPNDVNLDATFKAVDLKCIGNCYISYIIKAVLLFENNCFSPWSIKSELENYCEGYKECSLLANNSSIKYKNGEEIYSSPSQACKIQKVYIEYVYSRSDKPMFKENQVRRIYNSILVNPVYKSFLTLSIVLMLSFYGMGFLMGVSELKQSEIVDRLIKIAIIYLFTNPDFGWVWFEKFFVTFFKNGVDFLTFTMAELFDSDNANRINSAIKAGNFSNKSLIFGSVDRVVQLFLINDVIHKKIGALLFYNFFGILYVVIIYYSAIAYIYAISNAVLLYLTSQFFTSVLFIVGPIFFVFILFKQTRGFFDNWLNALIGFGLQQIFLIFTLSLFNSILYLVIKLTLGFRVCWDSVWHLNLPNGVNISLLSFWTIQDFPSYLGESVNPSAEGSSGSIPSIPELLSLWTICVIMKSFISTITDLAANLSGGISASELGSSVASGMNKMVDQVQNKWGDLYKKTGAKIIDRVDQRLFDSGALAKQARKKAKNTASSDNKTKAKMTKDGDKAVSNYKIENSEKYAGMTEGQKREKLKEVKTNAMKESAKSMGKTEKETDALMKDKSGSKYQGDNVFGAMMSIGKDRFTRGLSFGPKSLNEKSIELDTGMSKKEMNKTLKGMDNADDREKFINNVKNGNIQEKEKGRNDLAPSKNERQIAINQLQKSGDIVTPVFDYLGLAKRSEGAEEKILERIEKNRNEQSFSGGKVVDGKRIAKLNAFANYLEVKEGKNSKEDQLDAKRKLLNASSNKDEIKEIGDESKSKVIEKLKDEKSENTFDQKLATAEVNSAKNTLDSASNAEQIKPANKQLVSSEATLDNYEKKGVKIDEAIENLSPKNFTSIAGGSEKPESSPQTPPPPTPPAPPTPIEPPTPAPTPPPRPSKAPTPPPRPSQAPTPPPRPSQAPTSSPSSQ